MRLTLESCVVDLDAEEVLREGSRTPLTTIETKLLGWLAAQAPRTVPRDELLREVWGYAPTVVSRAADTAIKRLRKKVERDPAEPRHVLSVHGEGYRFRPLDRAPAPAEAPPIGREGLVQAALDALKEHRLVALHGSAGMGKTRVLREVLRRVPHVHADLSDRALVVGLAAALQVPLAGARDPVARLGDALADLGPTVVALDAFERAMPAPMLAAWLERAPDVRFLVASRVRLPDAGATIDVGSLAPDDAIALFVERARRAWPDVESESDAIATVVAELDGMPLAIELAAARVLVMPPATLAARARRGQDLVPGGPGAVLERAFDRSWELLDASDRSVLAQASVFARAFGLDDAEAVIEAPSVVDALDRLVGHALIRAVPAEGTFHLLATTRAYAAKQLADRDAVEARHERWFLDRAEGLGAATPEQLAALEPDLLAVHARARPDVAARVTLALQPLLTLRGPSSLVLQLLDPACAAPLDPPLRARAFLFRARERDQIGDADGCESDVQAGLEAVRAAQPPVPAVEAALLQLASYVRMSFRGEPEAARELGEAALVAARAAPPTPEGLRTLVKALDHLATVELRFAGWERAEALRTEAIAVARHAGSPRLLATVQANLGIAHLDRGECEAAAVYLEEAVAQPTERRQSAYFKAHLGAAYLQLGDPRAGPLLEEARREGRAIGHYRLELGSTVNLAIVEIDRGRAVWAEALLAQARAIGRGKLGRVARYLDGVAAWAALARGEPDRALTLATQAAEAADPGARATAELDRAVIAAAAGREDVAREALAAAELGQVGHAFEGLLIRLARAWLDPSLRDAALREARTPRGRGRSPAESWVTVRWTARLLETGSF